MLKNNSQDANKGQKNDDDREMQNYESQMSKISGATEFSYISDFSEVVKAKKNLKHKFLTDIL